MNNVYIIEADFGERLGKVFVETDRTINSRGKVVEMIRSGEVRPVKIIEICEDDGWVRDVTEAIQVEVALANADAEHAQGAKWSARELFQLDHARDYRKNGE